VHLSEIIGDIKIGLQPNHWATVITHMQFSVLSGMGQVKNKVGTQNYRKTEFQLLKELVNRTPWETPLRDKRAQQS